MWTIWDRQSSINGVSAKDYLARNPYFSANETILLKTVNGRVTEVQGKSILANIYNIDVNLELDAFIEAYEKALQPIEENETTND